MLRAQRLPLLITVVAALVLRILVPTGWMPAGSGAFAIELCPGAEARPMVMPVSGSAGDHVPHKDQHSGECAFAPFHAGSTPIDAVATIPAAAEIASAPKDLAPSRVRSTGPPALPPPSTGPPELA